MLWLLMLIIIALSVAISSNIIIVNSTSIDEVENYTNYINYNNNNNNNNNITLVCNISIIACLDNNPTYLQKIEDHNLQIDSILDQVNSTKLKEYVDILSSFPSRNSKSNYIDKVAYWLKDELQNLCQGRVFFHNYTQTDQNQTFNLKNIICSKQSLAFSSHYNKTIIIGAHYDSRAEILNNTNTRAPGADDNASGVSSLLELVRILSHLNLKLNLEFVLFSGEEQGLWGSEHYMKYIDKNNRTKI
jgi:hypothetical protein